MINKSIYDFVSNNEAANLHNLLNNYSVTTGNGVPEYEKGMYVCTKYNRLSLSRLHLSRITAYLEEKSGPCFNIEI